MRCDGGYFSVGGFPRARRPLGRGGTFKGVALAEETVRVPRYVGTQLLLVVLLLGGLAAWFTVVPQLVGPQPAWVLWGGFVGVGTTVYVAWALRAVRRWRHLAWAGGFSPVGDRGSAGFWLGMPDLHRAEGDRTVTVRTDEEGGDDDTRWTEVSVPVDGVPGDYALTVELEGPFGLFGSDAEVELGDRAFDEVFEVETSDAGATRRILDDATRHAVAEVRPYKRLTVQDGEVRHAAPTLVLDPDEIEAWVRAVVLVAQRIEAVLGEDDAFGKGDGFSAGDDGDVW